MRFLLTPPGSFRPTVIVDTHSELTPAHREQLRQAMYDANCMNGMLFDEAICVVLRDTLADEGPQAIEEVLELNTQELLRLVSASTLDQRAQGWLTLLSVSWERALPKDPTVMKLMYDFVPAVINTRLHIDEHAASYR